MNTIERFFYNLFACALFLGVVGIFTVTFFTLIAFLMRSLGVF